MFTPLLSSDAKLRDAPLSALFAMNDLQCHMAEATDEFEEAVGETGTALLNAIEPDSFWRSLPARWQSWILGWATGDPNFKVSLLQFVDVLPVLRTSADIAEHVRLYFGEANQRAFRVGSRAASSGAFRPILSRAVREAVFQMAERFIAGGSSREALPALGSLIRNGTAYTVDLLGEATLSDVDADAYLARYQELFIQLGTLGGPPDDPVRRPNVSIKLSALAAHFEPAAPEATIKALELRLIPLLKRAREQGIFINVDMEQYRFKDLTHRAFEAFALRPEFRDWDGLGIVVQAYLRDAVRDIDRLADLARRRQVPLTVRLVKGAYWDEEVVVARQESREAPVFLAKGATDASYERCSAKLIDHAPALRPAFASHNPRSIAQAMVRLEASRIDRAEAEFQMLYGMAEGLRKAVQSSGYRTRVYVPVGEVIPGMAYLVRRLLENTSNESWLLHRHEDAEPAEILRPPDATEPAAESRAGFVNHPPAEFYLSPDRARMRDALRDVRGSFGREYPLLIGGDAVTTGTWRTSHPVAEPNALMGRVAMATAVEVVAAVAAARSAFPAWRDTVATERARLLRRAAEIMAARRFELASIMVFECAKPWHEADGDVCEAIDYLNYYAGQAEQLGRGESLSLVPGETNRYLHEGRGVAGVIAPWNFPLALITGMTTGALAAGCTTVLKPATQSAIIAAHLVHILHEAGVPAGAVNYVPGEGNIAGRALVEHPDVDLLAFTGSNGVGLSIIESVSRHRTGQRGPRRVIAEMGGKNAVIVDDDADLDQAVAGVAASAFGYAGQKCSACSRVVVVESAYEEFRGRLAAAIESLSVGPPEDPFTFVPPLITRDAQSKVQGYIDIGLAEGNLVAKGRLPAGTAPYVPPHLFDGIDRSSRLAREEVFGPVLVMFRARTFDEALEVALDSEFALSGGLFSRNPNHIDRARTEFRVGNLYINRKITGAAVGRQPFGGFRMSGTDDKAGGPDYLRQFSLARVVTENTMRRGFTPG